MYVRNFEEKISSHPNFPRFWRRYVDDIFAIVKRNMITTLDWLNSIDQHLKFTHEVEADGCISFLELKIYRRGSDINIKIFRKPTTTDRYITSDSFHASKHRHAAFNSRLFNSPLNESDFDEEHKYIEKLARINGFSRSTLNSIMAKHRRKSEVKQLTTLRNTKNDSSTRNCFKCFPLLTNKMKNVKHNSQLVMRTLIMRTLFEKLLS